MKNKITIMLVLVMMLSFVSLAQATAFWFSGTSGDWANTATWAGGVVPTDSDPAGSVAYMHAGGTINVTTAGQGSLNLNLGYESGINTINVAAGIYFHVTQQLLMGYGGVAPGYTSTGILNIGVGASVLCEQLQLGVASGYHGIVNVADGGLLTSGMWGTLIGPGDTGSIHLIGTGSMKAWTYITIGDGSYIDIQAGTLKVYGDERDSLAALIADGKITGYNGAGTVNDPVLGTGEDEGWTIVTAVSFQHLTTPISLTKGIALDRFFSTIPPEATGTVDACDVALIKHMGFTFAKILVNPDVMISGNTINTSNMAYLDITINQFLAQGVPVVVCIHPQPEFKHTYLGTDWTNFTTLCEFYHDFAAYLAERWNKNEVVFQLMTEPFDNYTDWNNMWPHMYDQVRAAMPAHTMILGGADSGTVAGLAAVNPSLRPDPNVVWGFTHWSEGGVLPFVFQGANFGGYYPYLKNVPYPSNESLNAADYILPTCPSGQYSAALAAVNAYCDGNWNMAKQREVLQRLNTWNQAHGGNLKLFCYEMGSPIDPCQGSIAGGGIDPEVRIQYIHDKRQALEENNMGWTYWSYNETFTVIKYPSRLPFGKGMTRGVIDPATLIALGLSCGCGCVLDPPAADITGDCYVNFKDFAALANDWLTCTAEVCD